MKHVFVNKRYIDIVAAFYTKRMPYYIGRDRLDEIDWLQHLRVKLWWTDEIDAEFIAALEFCRKEDARKKKKE